MTRDAISDLSEQKKKKKGKQGKTKNLPWRKGTHKTLNKLKVLNKKYSLCKHKIHD